MESFLGICRNDLAREIIRSARFESIATITRLRSMISSFSLRSLRIELTPAARSYRTSSDMWAVIKRSRAARRAVEYRPLQLSTDVERLMPITASSINSSTDRGPIPPRQRKYAPGRWPEYSPSE